jgi:hypothetical protein
VGWVGVARRPTEMTICPSHPTVNFISLIVKDFFKPFITNGFCAIKKPIVRLIEKTLYFCRAPD